MRVAVRAIQPGAAKGPDRERRAADAARGQQARGRRAAEGHLGARAQSEPRGGAAADEPQERDVAREGKQLERGAGDDPAGIGVEDTAKGVGEGLQRPTGQDDHGDRDGREGGRERCAARQRAQVELRKHILGRGLVVSDVLRHGSSLPVGSAPDIGADPLTGTLIRPRAASTPRGRCRAPA